MSPPARQQYTITEAAKELASPVPPFTERSNKAA
jgi:hypothetical protein